LNLPFEILNLLKQKSKENHEYINPNFLVDVSTALYNYYDLEDNDVDKWIQDMFGA